MQKAQRRLFIQPTNDFVFTRVIFTQTRTVVRRHKYNDDPRAITVSWACYTVVHAQNRRVNIYKSAIESFWLGH